jgi:hypothetical protein
VNPNDVVTLRFERPGEPDRHDVAWTHVQMVVSKLHEVVEQAVGSVFTPKKHPAFDLLLVESPQRGSLEIILQFQLTAPVDFNTASAKHLLEIAKSGADFASDLAGIGSFVLALVMCRYGVIAQASKQSTSPPDDPLERFVAEEAIRRQSSMLNEVRALMNAAYGSGMEVDVEYRDCGRVRLNPAGYRRRGNFIAQHSGPKTEPLGNDLEVQVSDTCGPDVRFGGQLYHSALGGLGNGRQVVLISPENRPVPKGALIVRGAVVPNLLEIHAEQDLPDEYSHAEGAFLVSNYAIWQG